MQLLTLSRFEDRTDIAVLQIRGKPAILVGQLADALEYGESTDLSKLLDRSGEVVDGEDIALLEGDELATLKMLTPNLVGARAASVTILFESGINLAIMLSQQPKARPFRRWLASEVLPSLRQTGSYTLRAASPSPASPRRQAPTLPSDLRELPAGAVLELLDAEAVLGNLPGLRAALATAHVHRRLFEAFRLWLLRWDLTLHEENPTYTEGEHRVIWSLHELRKILNELEEKQDDKKATKKSARS